MNLKVELFILQFLMGVLYFLMGGTVASALHCFEDRRRLQESWFEGRSHCNNCMHNLSWWELIPVFGTVLLGARCKECHFYYGWRYAIEEAVLGLIYVVISHLASSPLEMIILFLLAGGAIYVYIFICGCISMRQK